MSCLRPNHTSLVWHFSFQKGSLTHSPGTTSLLQIPYSTQVPEQNNILNPNSNPKPNSDPKPNSNPQPKTNLNCKPNPTSLKKVKAMAKSSQLQKFNRLISFSPEDHKPCMWRLLLIGTLEVYIRDLVPLVLVEGEVWHQIRISLKHCP